MARVARQLPAQIDAEACVIGACMSDTSGTAVAKVLELLEARHFWSPNMRTLFEVIRHLYDSSQPVDCLLVLRELDRRHQLETLVAPSSHMTAEQAGRQYVTELAAMLPVVNQVPHHCKLIIEAWGKREVIQRFTEPMQDAWNGASPGTVLRRVEEACQTLHGMIEDDGKSQVVPALEAATRAYKRVTEEARPGGSVPAPYGFLDALMPGRLYVLGGYAKDGKTVVAGQAARRACEAKVRTGFVSIEMAEPYLTDRLIAGFGIPYGPLQGGIVSDRLKAEWTAALARISSWPLEIFDDPGCEVSDIIRFQKLGHFEFLIVDHLHQMAYEQNRDARLALSANVKSLAQLARKENIPILLLAQLHRPPSQDGFPRPTMQSFKETGTIEQVASALWAIWRKRNADTGARTEDAQLLVLADRFGSDSANALHFTPQYQRFEEIDWRRDA